MSERPRELDHAAEDNERTIAEHMEIAASDLVERTKELMKGETCAA